VTLPRVSHPTTSLSRCASERPGPRRGSCTEWPDSVELVGHGVLSCIIMSHEVIEYAMMDPLFLSGRPGPWCGCQVPQSTSRTVDQTPHNERGGAGAFTVWAYAGQPLGAGIYSLPDHAFRVCRSPRSV
jgi:hypothetical protein